MGVYKKILFVLFAAGLGLTLASCGTAPVRPAFYGGAATYTQPAAGLRQDAIHTVGPGETLWRIAKIYDVSANDIAAANKLPDPSKLEMGQSLLIPNAASVRPVITVYKTDKWKYIIVHHSATDEGAALVFYKEHRDRGWDTIGYDFVIDNGSNGRQDGQIETTPRWVKQIDGAHCKAGGMNSMGIGICLVGNFNKDNVSPKQMDSLVYLVGILSDSYRIPASNIMGHGKVPGARTDCPGKKFPWNEFYSRITSKR